MSLDKGTLRLIAVGASVTANCLPCLEHNVTRALASGLAPEEIADAIEVGKLVRQGAAGRMDELIGALNPLERTTNPALAADCCAPNAAGPEKTC